MLEMVKLALWVPAVYVPPEYRPSVLTPISPWHIMSSYLNLETAMQGFLLGLSSGVTCLAYCAPVLVPYLLGEGHRTARNWGVLAQFMAGRLAGYLLFGLLAWTAQSLVLGLLGSQSPLFGVLYVVLAGLLLVYGLVKMPTVCATSLPGLSGWLRRWPALLPAGLGLFTGLNLCPPFLLAFANAANSASLLQSVLFFLLFFIGTSLYFVPLPFVGTLHRFPALRIIGKFAAVIIAVYYLLYGIVLIAGGIRS